MAHYVCICGGRDEDTPEHEAAMRDILWFLKAFYGVGLRVMHGDARGIDRLAGRVAAELEIPVKAYPADWGRGKRGGIERNEYMAGLLVSWEQLEHSTEVIAFPGGRGTAHMSSFSEKLGLNVTYLDLENPRPPEEWTVGGR